MDYQCNKLTFLNTLYFLGPVFFLGARNQAMTGQDREIIKRDLSGGDAYVDDLKTAIKEHIDRNSNAKLYHATAKP
jgi:hypothetical protein